MSEIEHGIEWAGLVDYFIEGVALGIVGVLGLLGNLASILLINDVEMALKPTFRRILSALLVFDIFCIIFNLLIFSFPQLSFDYFCCVFPYVAPTVLPLAQISLTGSIYSTVALTIERYLCVCHPHNSFSKKSGVRVITLVVLFSILINVTRFFEIQTVIEVKEYKKLINGSYKMENFTTAVIAGTELRENPIYSQITMAMMTLIGEVIPLVILICLNRKTYERIKDRNSRLAMMTSMKRRDETTAAVFVTIVLVFIACNSFKLVANLYESYIMYQGLNLNAAWKPSMDVVAGISHFLLTLNSSTNFLIYSFKDETFHKLLFKKAPSLFNCLRKSPSMGEPV